MEGTVLNSFHGITHLFSTTPAWSRYHYSLHSTDDTKEEQRGWVMCPRLYLLSVTELGFEYKSLASRTRDSKIEKDIYKMVLYLVCFTCIFENNRMKRYGLSLYLHFNLHLKLRSVYYMWSMFKVVRKQEEVWPVLLPFWSS